MKTETDFGMAVRQALVRGRHPSREAAAKAIGLSRSQLWRITTGETSPTADQLRDIADACGVDLLDLVKWAIQGAGNA